MRFAQRFRLSQRREGEAGQSYEGLLAINLQTKGQDTEEK